MEETARGSEAVTRPSPWAFSGASGWARYGVSLLATVATVAALVSIGETVTYVEAGVLGVAGLLMIIDQVAIHALLRALLWGILAIGAIAFASPMHGSEVWETAALFGGSSIALLALGAAGLDSTTGSFNPRVLRRTLLTMMIVGLSVAHVLVASAVLTELVSHEVLNPLALALPSTVLTRVSMFATPAMLVLGVIGLSRTRSWGLFAYLGGLLGIVVTIALAYTWTGADHFDGFVSSASTGWVVMMSILWGFSGAVALVAALPVLAALVFKQKPSADPPRKWGRWVHAGLVLTMVLGAVVLRLS